MWVSSVDLNDAMEEECWIAKGIVPELDRVPFLLEYLVWQSSVPSAWF